MPEAMIYHTDLESQEAKELESIYNREMDSRKKVIDRAWDYYQGEHRKPLKSQSDGYDDNIILNQIGNLADRIADFMIGEGIEFQSTGEGQSDRIDQELAAVWKSNQGMRLLNSLMLAGAIEGHLAILVNPETLELSRIKQQHFSAFWDVFSSDILWYRLQHKSGLMGKRIDYVKGLVRFNPNEVDHSREEVWTILEYKLEQGSWKLAADPIYYERDIPPLIDWQNKENLNSYYGFSDVDEAIKLNDALNFILSNMQRIIKHYADPKTIGIGFDTSEIIKTSVGGFFSINKPRSETDVFNLEMQSDLISSSSLADKLFSAIWHSGSMVDPQSVKDAIGRLTNFGLQVLFSDAVKSTEKKRLLYEQGLERVNLVLLDGLNLAYPEKIDAMWSSILPQDEKEESETLSLDLVNGIISKETYREIKGYDNEKEAERLAEESSSSLNVLDGLFNQTNGTFNAG